ncbi:hypothetical protein MBLNU457_6865t1 [Dothideomycetes sp. NU457]
MADIAFGVVASGVGILGFVGQLASGLKTLNDLRNNFNDAQKEIDAATELLNAVLGILSSEPIPASCNIPAVHEAFKICEEVARQTLQKMGRVSQGMQTDKSKIRKMFARLKAAFKKDELLELLDKVQRAETTLIHARVLVNTSITHDTYTTATDTRTIVQSFRNEAKQDSAIVHQRVIDIGSSLRSFHSETKQDSASIRQRVVDTQYSLQSFRNEVEANSALIHERVIDTGSSLQSFRNESNDGIALILRRLDELGHGQAVVTQDETSTKTLGRRKRLAAKVEAKSYLIRLQWLLSTNFEASLLDVNADGDTAMGIVFRNFTWSIYGKTLDEQRRQIDRLFKTVTLLLTYRGAPIFEESMQSTPENAWRSFDFTWWYCFADEPALNTEFARMLPMCLRGATVLMNEQVAFRDWTLVELLYSEPTYKQLDWRPWSSISIRERLSGYLGCGYQDNPGFDPTAMLRALGIDSFDVMWSNCDKEMTRRLINAMLDTITAGHHYLYNHHDCVGTALGFREFISSCNHEQDMLHQTFDDRTFFLEHIKYDTPHGSGVHGEDCCEGAVCFATVLRCLGIDLVEFGDAELHCWAKYNRARRWDNGSKLCCFEYGPDPNDWRVFRIDRGEQQERDLVFAQDFWDLVEHPQLNVPGSWPSSDAYPEDYGDDYGEYYWPGASKYERDIKRWKRRMEELRRERMKRMSKDDHNT